MNRQELSVWRSKDLKVLLTCVELEQLLVSMIYTGRRSSSQENCSLDRVSIDSAESESASNLSIYTTNCHSDHLFEYLTLTYSIESVCGDTIDNDIVATVGRNTNDAKFVVDDKLQDVSYPCPRYDVVNSTLPYYHYV